MDTKTCNAVCATANSILSSVKVEISAKKATGKTVKILG